MDLVRANVYFPAEIGMGFHMFQSSVVTMIMEQNWEIRRPNGDIRSSSVTFRADSTIAGYAHPNEATWEVQGGRLMFRGQAGDITSISNKLTPGDEAFCMMSPHDPATVAHRLRPMPRNADTSIIWERPDQFAFSLTPKILDAFANHRIYSANRAGTSRWKVGDILTANRHYRLQKYTGIYAGNHIPAIGSFSYAYSDTSAIKSIGRYCSISWNVRVMGTSHPHHFVTSSDLSYQSATPFAVCMDDFGVSGWEFLDNPQKGPPQIGNDVWIGQDVLLAQGVTLGDGCVVAAGSVVTKGVPPFAIVGGAPAKIIKYRFSREICDELAPLQWWRYAFPHICKLKIEAPEAFIRALRSKIDRGEIDPWEPEGVPLIDLAGGHC